VPLIVLAAGSLILGFLGIPEFMVSGGNRFGAWLAPALAGAHGATHGGEHAAHASAALEWGLMLLSLAVAAGGILLGLLYYVRRPELATRLVQRFPALYRTIANKYYVDEIYSALIVRPVQSISRGFLWQIVDVKVIDLAVNLVGILSRVVSYVVRFVQTGYVQFYAAVVLVGVVVLLWVMF
jgi:NADH-quinone oxidoreductase subunit L